MNLRTLAKLADVSVSTVSKAFSNSAEISPETKERIFNIAKLNGCYDKYIKKNYDKRVIAVICPEVRSDYYNKFLTLLKLEIESNNGVMTIGIDDFSEEKKQELFAYYSSYCNVDGIIILGSANGIVNSINIPSVNIGAPSDDLHIDSIDIKWCNSMNRAVSYLKECGHIQIGYAGETLTKHRLELFKNALRSNGVLVNEDYIHTSDQRFERAGEEYVDKISKLDTPPTAVIAAYDNIAIGIIKSAKNRGVKIPEDLSVIGTDDISMATYIEPSLSTISSHTEVICKKAVDIIFRKIDNEYFRSGLTIIESDFIPRDSVYKK